MFVWVSKGLLSLSRDYFNGVTYKTDKDKHTIHLLQHGGSVAVTLEYELLEKDSMLADMQIFRDVLLNIHRNPGSLHPPRMFNPPGDLVLEEEPQARTRRTRAARSLREHQSEIFSAALRDSTIFGSSTIRIPTSSPEVAETSPEDSGDEETS